MDFFSGFLAFGEPTDCGCKGMDSGKLENLDSGLIWPCKMLEIELKMPLCGIFSPFCCP